MKLSFFGTSHGVPMATRFCSMTVIEEGDSVYLIDAGAPAADLLIRNDIPFEKIRAVFITHSHGDHTFGLPTLCSLASWYYQKSAFSVYLTDERFKNALQEFIAAADDPLHEDRIQLKLCGPGPVYEDENIKVTAYATQHTKTSVSYLVECGGKRIVFTGDMRLGDPCDFPEICLKEETDAIICEMAHFPFERVFPIIEQCRTKHVYFNHVFWDYKKHMDLIREANGKYPFEVKAVNDGDVVIF